MLSYITKRYAPIITKYDVKMLFGWLKEAYGSIAKAARATGVQRKTVYDWDTLTEEVRLETKSKILEQCMKLYENQTQEFLIRKTDNDLKEILQHYLRSLYEKSMKANSKEDLSKHLEVFQRIQKNHRGAIFDNQPNEIEEMFKALAVRAKKFQIDLVGPSIHLIRPEILADKIVALLKIIEMNKLEVEEMRKSFDLPPGLIDNICKARNYLDSSKSIDPEFDQTRGKIPLDSGIDWFVGLRPKDIDPKDQIRLHATRAAKKRSAAEYGS